MKLPNEYRVFGPPGTGKTTYLSKQISEARKKYGSDKVFVTSFTRAAAIEIASRDGAELPKNAVGTLHSHCYRALGAPKLAESCIEEFNKEYPQYSRNINIDVDDPYSLERVSKSKTNMIEAMNRYRSALVPEREWPNSIRTLYNIWSEWKRENGLVDFTDLLEMALKDVKYAPGRPAIGYVDEAQDMTPLQFALVRKWSVDMDTLVIAGDDQQCLYDFLGASPDSMLDPPLPDDHITILSQSYRLPRKVLDWSEKIIEKVQRRQKKEYKARMEDGKEVEGNIRVSRANSCNPSLLLAEVEKDIARNKNVMVIASCSYMLLPFIKLLIKEGVAFHNPYRQKACAWNPLSWGRGDASVEILTSFIRFSKNMDGDDALMVWTADDLEDWLPFVSSKILKRGIKTKVENAQDFDMFRLTDVFSDEAAVAIASGNEQDRLDLFRKNLTKEGKKRMEYPLKLLMRRPDQFFSKPRLVVGTIHSVKGGEADIVYVIPDLSRPQKAAWHGSRNEADAIRRLFYVAGTRAREELVLCSCSHSTEGFPLMEGLRT